jgi:RNA polymerase sigma-70 factor, ECF subfamily
MGNGFPQPIKLELLNGRPDINSRSLSKNAMPLCYFPMNSLTIPEQEVLRMLGLLRKHLETTLSPALLAKFSVDDILQETYIRAVSGFNAAEFQNDSMLLAWLKKIANNIAISLIRKKDAGTTLFANNSSDIAQQLLDSGELTPSDLVSAKENRQLLALAVTKLAENHQRVIQMRYHEQLQFEEIAHALNTTAGAARGLHRNALDKLRDYLGDMARFLSSQ